MEEINKQLSEKFGAAIVNATMEMDFPCFVVQRAKLKEILAALKNDPKFGYSFLTTMCGLHYPDNKGEELGVMYQLHNLAENKRIRIKTFFPNGDEHVDSITDLFAAANWMERQEFDFFGIKFKGHPNLKRILNVDDMDYHPMRKEYPLEDATREDKNDTMFGR